MALGAVELEDLMGLGGECCRRASEPESAEKRRE